MRIGLFFLVLAYMLSQFFRVFLAVLAPVLEADLGAGPEALARASGLWFLTFALMQIPVGWALDRIGPRRIVAVLLGFGGAGGSLMLALARAPLAIDGAMVLIGVGCSSVLMAAYYILARTCPAALFGTLAGAIIGFGSFGNLAGSVPLAWAIEAFGWRQSVLGLAVMTLAVAVALALFVRDPPRAGPAGPQGSLLELLAMPTLWPILCMMAAAYGPGAALRGLWIGPYLADVQGADAAGIGRVTLGMALAMIAGNFAYGPLDRLTGTRKGVVLTGNLMGAACFLALWAAPGAGVWQVSALMAAAGFFGSSFAMIMAHGRAFLPPHLVGRGVTLINLFGIGGAGLMQLASGWLHHRLAAASPDPAAPYGAIFLGFGLILLAGCIVYAVSRDRTD